MIHIVSLKVLHGLTHFLLDCFTLHLRFNYFVYMKKTALANPKGIPCDNDSFTAASEIRLTLTQCSLNS